MGSRWLDSSNWSPGRSRKREGQPFLLPAPILSICKQLAVTFSAMFKIKQDHNCSEVSEALVSGAKFMGVPKKKPDINESF